MIDPGYPQEAMHWVEVFLGISIATIQNDAPDADRLRFQNLFKRLCKDLGSSTPADCKSRYIQANSLKDDMVDVADPIVQHNSDIIDWFYEEQMRIHCPAW